MKVISIEINGDMTYGLEMDYKTKNPKVYKSFAFPTPEGTIADGQPTKSTAFKKALVRQIKENNIKAKQVAFVVNSSKIANRVIEIPKLKDAQVLTFIESNASDYFPVDLNQYQLVYRPIEEKLSKEEKESKSTRKINVYAVPNVLVTTYRELAEFCDFNLAGLDYIGNSLFQMMKKISNSAFTALVKMDQENTMITIMDEGEVALQRMIYYGTLQAEQALEHTDFAKDYEGFSPREIMCKEACLNTSFKEENNNTDITKAMEMTITNIGRIFDYYASQNQGKRIQKCILVGSATGFQGMKDLMSSELGLDVETLSDVKKAVSGLQTGKYEIGEFFAAMGSALAPMTFELGEKNPEEILLRKKSAALRLSKLFLIGSVLISATLSGVAFYQKKVLEDEVKNLEKEKYELSYLQEVVDQYNTTKTSYDDIMAMSQNLKTTSTGLTAVIEEMENKLPNNATVISLTSDLEGVTMNITVKTKKEAAKVIEQLKTFDAFQDVKTSAIAEEEDEDGNKTVNFIVTSTYKKSLVDGEQTDNKDANATTDKKTTEQAK